MTEILTEATPMTWVNPALGRNTSGYGPRPAPLPSPHLGHDIAPPTPGQLGVQFHAAGDGVVARVVWLGTDYAHPEAPRRSGWLIKVAHPGGCQTWYQHARQEDIRVREGQTVKAGDVLATMGDSGNVQGVHLHFEVHPDGSISTTTDPAAWLAARGVSIGTGPTQEDDMAKFTDQHAAVLDWLWAERADFDQLQFKTGDLWTYRQRWVDTQAQVAGLRAALEQVNKTGGTVDLAAITEAARKGAAAAIDSIEVKVVGA